MSRRKRLLSNFIALSMVAILFGCNQGGTAHKTASEPKAEIKTARPAAVTVARTPEVERWCSEFRQQIKKLNWTLDPCDGVEWKIGGESVQGRPLVYTEFGNPNSTNTTLILSMVHGDEITPAYLGLQVVHWMMEHRDLLANAHVVIAPLVNPDGFYRSPKTRMNARGVDVNRNFATGDWPKDALRAWKSKHRSDPRRFPGAQPHSEPETIFQEKLIAQIHPQKILSVHAPLNHLDYDGPSTLALSRFSSDYVRECMKLRNKLRAVSSGFFPGSLGNFAGNEKGIPTVTLELPSIDPRKAEKYWHDFSPGLRTMIEFTVPLKG